MLFISMGWDDVSELRPPSAYFSSPRYVGEPWWNNINRVKLKKSDGHFPSATLSTNHQMSWSNASYSGGLKSWPGWPAILIEVCRSFPQSLQTNAVIVPSIRPWPLHLKSFQFIVHFSPFHFMLYSLSYWKSIVKETINKHPPHKLTRVRTQASAVRGRRLTAWAMERPTYILSINLKSI
jgi:hypothetical protein